MNLPHKPSSQCFVYRWNERKVAAQEGQEIIIVFRKDLVMARNKQNAEEDLLGHGAPKQHKGAPTHNDKKKGGQWL